MLLRRRPDGVVIVVKHAPDPPSLRNTVIIVLGAPDDHPAIDGSRGRLVRKRPAEGHRRRLDDRADAKGEGFHAERQWTALL